MPFGQVILYASHDFQSQTQDNGEIAARIFATHFGHLAIRITTDIFSTWRAAGITCEHELFVTSIALLSLSALFLHCCTECDLV